MERLRNREMRSFWCQSEPVFFTLLPGVGWGKASGNPIFFGGAEAAFPVARTAAEQGRIAVRGRRPRAKKGEEGMRFCENLLAGWSYNTWRGKALAGLSGPARRAEGRKKPLPDSSLFFIICEWSASGPERPFAGRRGVAKKRFSFFRFSRLTISVDRIQC